MTTQPTTDPPAPAVSQTQRQTACPDARFHGKPYRFCGFPGCGWTEPPDSTIGQET